jgi:SAM-dependent methyltransferase
MTQNNARCPVCGDAERRLLYPATSDVMTRPESLYFETGHGPIVQCRSCSMIYAHPQPSGADLETEYGEIEVREYMSELPGRERQFANNYQLIEQFMPPGRLLDVGCFTGVSLAVARKRGWQVAGLEPSRLGRRTALECFGLDVWPGILPDPGLPSASFDAVTLWDVIEHMPDPGAVVRDCWRLLRPGGVLGLGTPDVGSPLARCLGGRWMWLIRIHFHYFSRATMRRLLTDSGFALEHIGTQTRYFTVGHLVRRVGAYAPFVSRSLAALSHWFPAAQSWLAPINLFDCMVVIARKP